MEGFIWKVRALSIRLTVPEISERERMVRKFPWKVLENPKTVKLPKCEPFNRPLREQNRMEWKFPRILENLTRLSPYPAENIGNLFPVAVNRKYKKIQPEFLGALRYLTIKIFKINTQFFISIQLNLRSV